MNNCAKFGEDRIVRAGVKNNTFVRLYSIFSFPFLFYSCHRLQREHLNRLSWLMAQNAWIRARKCLLYV